MDRDMLERWKSFDQDYRELFVTYCGEKFMAEVGKVDVDKLDYRERMVFEERLKVYRDLHNMIEMAWQKGVEKGRKKEKMSIASKMKSMGCSIEDIVAVTELSAEEIADL